MKKRMSWYWALPAVAGLALVMVALTSWGSGPTAHAQETPATNTPVPPTATRTPTSTPVCDLRITKDADDSTVPELGTSTWTIKVKNNGDESCTPDIVVSDDIPNDTDCTDASVDSSSDIVDADVNIDGCDSSGTVTWDTSHNLASGDSLILDLSLKLTSGANEDDEITNKACITDPANLLCDSDTITVGGAATSTPQPTATTAPPVVIPTVIVPPPVVPTARALPTLSAPSTGTGSDDNSHALPVALGAIGACLLLVSGAVVVKRTR